MTADVWAELAPTVLADTIANDLRDLVRAYENSRPRSQQQAIGPSGIGSPCVRCLAREVLGTPVVRDFDDPWFRVIGTAVHAWLADAATHANTAVYGRERYLVEEKVHPDGYESEILPKGGDSDLYDDTNKTVIDHKVVGLPKIKKVREHGPGQQYRYQAHLYGRGFKLLGIQVDHVAIAFWNRNGFLKDLHVWTEPYDEHVALEALNRFRTIRGLALGQGAAILPHLPADPDCWSCAGRDDL